MLCSYLVLLSSFFLSPKVQSLGLESNKVLVYRCTVQFTIANNVRFALIPRSMAKCLSRSIKKIALHTVDGRNPAPAGRWCIPF